MTDPVIIRAANGLTATLYCGDWRTIGPVSADLIVADPPYGIAHPCDFAERGRGATAGDRPGGGGAVWANPRSNDYPDVAGDGEPFDPAPLLALGLPTCLWGGNHFASRLPDSGGWLVWDKLRPDDLDQATCELAWTNFVKGVRRYSHLWNGMMRASERGENYHPTQKPVALFSWLLALRWTPPGTVFDPFMGSGPCGVAAIRAGRNYVGCELSAEYFAIAKRRIEAEAAQAKLFTEPAAPKEQRSIL